MNREFIIKYGSFPVGLALLWALSGCSKSSTALEQPATELTAEEELFATVIRQPPVPQGVKAITPSGETVSLQCSACHSIRPHSLSAASASDLDEFHQGMQFQHGSLTCSSCHQPEDGYSSLRKADGTSVAFSESIQLCGQCHGTQLSDYQHGAHGGMTGHWDLTRGGRERNHCLHCHDAHQPAYPAFQPVAPPRDRFTPATHHTTSLVAPHSTSVAGAAVHE